MFIFFYGYVSETRINGPITRGKTRTTELFAIMILYYYKHDDSIL